MISMLTNKIKKQLVEAGLDEGSVERMLRHYKDMRFHFGNGKYEEASVHIGKFCENAGNIVLDILGQPIESSPSLGPILNTIEKLEKNQISQDVDLMIKLTIPRFLRAAHDMRSKRDGVHTNLVIPVNHGDSSVAVQICSWVLAEFIRVYGAPNNLTEARKLIDSLAQPLSPFFDEYNGIKLIMSNQLKVSQEILVHLNNSPGGELEVENLISWIPNADSNHIKTNLRQMAERRMVHYTRDKAKITPLGVKAIEDVIKGLGDEKISTE